MRPKIAKTVLALGYLRKRFRNPLFYPEAVRVDRDLAEVEEGVGGRY